MKRLFSILLVAAFLSGAALAQSFDQFETAFGGFAENMAASLAVNSTVGTIWSDAYVGDFPHFGAGVNAGAAFTGAGTAEPLFSALGQTAPAELAQFGVPIPALVLSAKLGLPFLRMDIGLKGGLITPEMADALKSAYGVSAEYKNLGAQLRIAVLKESGFLPDISLGLGFNYQQGRIKTGMGVGTTTLVNGETINGHVWDVTATDPLLDLGWESTTVDGTLQVSKTLFSFLTPYAGVGYTMGKSSVTGGVASALTFVRDSTPSDYTTLQGDFAAMGGTAPALSATGFTYSADSTTPVFRIYGGLSLKILIVLDIQVMYVPVTGNLGASAMVRFQL